MQCSQRKKNITGIGLGFIFALAGRLIKTRVPSSHVAQRSFRWVQLCSVPCLRCSDLIRPSISSRTHLPLKYTVKHKIKKYSRCWFRGAFLSGITDRGSGQNCQSWKLILAQELIIRHYRDHQGCNIVFDLYTPPSICYFNEQIKQMKWK